jgi:hypothetical protein
MPLEIGLWRVDDKPIKLATSSIRLEARLEELIESDVTILGEPLLLVGRQVSTSYGKVIDLMGVDADGVLHVLELKRNRTPREVVAQVLDYGSWVGSLTHEDILEILAAYGAGEAFEQAFSAKFGVSPPETLNESHRLTVIASDVDPATERIVEYLAPTWLIDEARTPSVVLGSRPAARSNGTARTGTCRLARRAISGTGTTPTSMGSSPLVAEPGSAGPSARCR